MARCIGINTLETAEPHSGSPMRAVIALVLCAVAAPAVAQPSRVEIESALTQLLVGEAGWDNELDHTAILFAVHQLDKQEVRSTDLLETFHYHIPWWDNGAPPKRPWIAGVNTSCEEPAGFPSNWQRHQRWCIAIVRRVRDYYAGKLRNPCKGTPNNWRARGRPSRKAKRIYYHVGCGRRSLHNFFDTHRGPNGKSRKPIQARKRRARLGRTASPVDVPRAHWAHRRGRRLDAVLDALPMRHAGSHHA